MRNRIWTKNFTSTAIINFFAVLMFYLLIVTIGNYTIETYNASTSMAGLVSSIYVIGALAGRLMTGRLIEKIGPYKILQIGVIGFFLASCLYFIEIHVTFLLAVRFIQGIFVGIIGSAAGTIIAYILPPDRKGEGIGYYSLSAILATAIGPFIGILLMKFEHGNMLIFGFNVCLSLCMIAMLAFVKLDMEVKKTAHEQEMKQSFLSKVLEPKSIPISFVALLIGFAYSGVMSYISTYAKEIGLVSAASLFFIVYAFATIITRPVCGKIMDNRGPNIIVYPALILFGFGMFLFSEAHTATTLLVSAALIGFGFGNFNSIAQTIAVKVTEPHRFGFATSTYYIFYDLGLGFGPYLLGILVPILGFRTMFMWLVPLIIICIPLYFALHGRKAKLYI